MPAEATTLAIATRIGTDPRELGWILGGERERGHVERVAGEWTPIPTAFDPDVLGGIYELDELLVDLTGGGRPRRYQPMRRKSACRRCPAGTPS